MNDITDITQATLQSLTVPTMPTASMKSHQVHLKRALQAASRPDHSSNLKQGWRDFMSKKKFVISGATLAFTALAIVAISVFGTQSPEAYAQQLAAQGVQKVSKLSPDQQQKLNQHLNGGNALDDLKAAEHAKDLTVLTYDQFVKQESQIGIDTIRVSGTAASGNGLRQIDLHSLKFLRYTDAQGAIHILGVDTQGLPALELIFQTSSAKTTVSSQGAAHVSVDSGSTNSSNAQPSASPTSSSITHSSVSSVVKPTSTPVPVTVPASTPPPVQPQTPLSVLTSVIAGLGNGQATQTTTANVAIPGPISTTQGRPIVFTANGQTYFAYTQGQKPNFNTTPAQTASTMAIVAEPASDSGVTLTSAYLDKGSILVDPDQTAVGYSTGGN